VSGIDALDIEVVQAVPEDAEAIRMIEGLSDATRRLLDHDLAAADRCCLVARLGAGAGGPDGVDEREDGAVAGAVDGGVIGFAAGIMQLQDAHVIDLAVAPAARRRGIGRRLLLALLGQVRARGATAATLEVRPSNDGSRALYGQLGFVEEGRRPRYYPDGEDALLLWLRDLSDVPDPVEVG
jgi:ribosomal-protein-alanine acetyltransferase